MTPPLRRVLSLYVSDIIIIRAVTKGIVGIAMLVMLRAESVI